MAFNRIPRRARGNRTRLSAPLAAATTAATAFERLEARQLMAFALNVNFQPGSAAVPAGYVADAGSVYGNRGGGFTFGWDVGNSTATRDRNSAAAPDQRYDTLTHTQQYGNRTWEVAVPNGTYQVRIVGGDAGFTGSTIRFNAEGALVADGTTTTASRFVDATKTVTVSDGKLTISNAAGAVDNKLCFVEISDDVPTPNPIPNIPGTIQAEDFDAGASGVAYFDTTAGNSGGQYRNTNVDVQSASEGGFAVGYIRATEWLKYTFNAPSAGTYALDVRVASGSSGGVFHVEIDGVDKTGPINLANTGGWQAWKTLTKTGIAIGAGQHQLRLVFDKANGAGDIGNVNWLKLSTGNPTLPVVSVAANDGSAAEAGANTGKFRITRTGSTASPLTISYLLNGSATNGTDYNTLVGSVTIPAGAAFADVTVTPKQDSAVEGSESVVLTLVNGSGFTLGNSASTVNIADDDAPAPGGDWPTTWTKGPNIPKARWESSAALLDGKIYAFGGWMSASAIATQQVDVYDIASKTWSTLKPYAPIPHSHAALAVDEPNHTIYFAGGLYGNYPGVPTNKVWKFNAQTQVWTELPSMPENRSSGGLAFVNGQLHYLGGVEDDRETNTSEHIVLDVNNFAAGWRNAPAMPDGRDHFSTIVLGGKIYAIGGEFGHDKLHDQEALVDRYDPVAKTWQRLADMPTPKSHAESSTFVWNGKIVVAGGQVDNYKSTDEVVMYDPASNQWSTLGKLPTPLQGPIVQVFGNQIIVTTGNRGQGPIGDLWIGELG